MNNFIKILQKNQKTFIVLYVTLIMLLLGILAYSYSKNRAEKESKKEVPSIVDTEEEDEATTVPDINAVGKPLHPQIPEDIKDIRAALPFTSKRFDVIYDSKTDTFIVTLKEDHSESEKEHVRDWFERFPEFDDGNKVKITWLNSVEK